MLYNFTAEFDRELTETLIDDIFDTLAVFHVAIGGRGDRTSLTITLPGENLAQAVSAAIVVTERAMERPALAIEALSTRDFDLQMGLEPESEMVGVTEVAKMMRVTRQAVLGMIVRRRFSTAERVAGNWVIAREEVYRELGDDAPSIFDRVIRA